MSAPSQEEELRDACRDNDYDAVVSLIESGVDPNCRNEYVRHLFMYCVGIGGAGLVSQNISSLIIIFFLFTGSNTIAFCLQSF